MKRVIILNPDAKPRLSKLCEHCKSCEGQTGGNWYRARCPQTPYYNNPEPIDLQILKANELGPKGARVE